jgi:hypothetical protein
MIGKIMGPCLATAILMLIIGYFIGAAYPATAHRISASLTGG